MKFKRLAVAAACALVSSMAFAEAHFVRGPTASLSSSGDYVVSFKEVGLGNIPVTYSLVANEAIYTYQCFNPAGNTPVGEPNGVKESDASVFVTMQPRNGQITGSVTLSPSPGDARCQGNAMKMCLVAVSYSGVWFKEETTPVGPFSMPSLSMTLSKPDCDI
ncbi:MAG TPA: hypothetical protein VFT37_08625 [Telluria sp.]|nr:hypothetical protein [Telluria sp.]